MIVFEFCSKCLQTSEVSLLAPMGPSPEATMVIFLVAESGPLISPATRGSTCAI